MAHFAGGVPVVEAYAYGRAFSRVDVRLGPRGPELVVHPPHEICREGQTFAECTPGEYAGVPVTRDLDVAGVIAPALERAQKKRDEPLGVSVAAPIRESFSEPSALGNLFADLLREAVPGADAAIMNGGGVRAPFPAGPLTYGALHEAMPFDNTLAVVRLTGRELAAVLAGHLASDRHGILSISGIHASARCDGQSVAIELRRQDGSPIADGDEISVVVSDYLATGGDELFAPARLSPGRVKLLPELLRDALARRLSARGGSLDGSSFLDPARPRLALPGKRPVRCP
jgi:5'-nucleotidase